MVTLDDFQWRRPARRQQGYTWEAAGDDMVLVSVPDVPQEEYMPHPGLFRDFAFLDPSPEAILRFANRYGELGPKTGQREYLSQWVSRINSFRWLVELADALDNGSEEGLRDALGTLTDADRRAVAEVLGVPPSRVKFAKFCHAELIQAAAAHIGTVLLTRRAFFEGLSVRGELFMGKAQIRFMLADLLAFMFWQFGVSLVISRKFRQCQNCGKCFQVAPGTGRADKATCSGSCRFLLYRKRKQRAIELQAKGWNVRKIAKEVGSDVSRVKRWVSTNKRKAK
jgi:hypothetical protein